MKVFGTILIIIALLLAGGWWLDSVADTGQSSLLKAVQQADTNPGIKNYGKAPEFAGIHKWLNSPELKMSELKGKVVLVDFWTYSCINCIRTFPYLKSWYEKYQNDGFVIVGVHTPEFAFEKDTGNVQTAIQRHGLTYPVAQDNDYETWKAYSNRYWPAHYLVDKDGNIMYVHFGEGKYDETEKAIQTLLGSTNEEITTENPNRREVKTPEIYFGLSRIEHLSKYQIPAEKKTVYSFPSQLPDNTFSVEGEWSFNDEFAKLEGNNGRIRLNFHAKDVHMVAKSDSESLVKVFVDGILVKTLTINESDLYTLYEGDESGQRILELEIEGQTYEMFTFTFG